MEHFLQAEPGTEKPSASATLNRLECSIGLPELNTRSSLEKPEIPLGLSSMGTAREAPQLVSSAQQQCIEAAHNLPEDITFGTDIGPTTLFMDASSILEAPQTSLGLGTADIDMQTQVKQSMPPTQQQCLETLYREPGNIHLRTGLDSCASTSAHTSKHVTYNSQSQAASESLKLSAHKHSASCPQEKTLDPNVNSQARQQGTSLIQDPCLVQGGAQRSAETFLAPQSTCFKDQPPEHVPSGDIAGPRLTKDLGSGAACQTQKAHVPQMYRLVKVSSTMRPEDLKGKILVRIPKVLPSASNAASIYPEVKHGYTQVEVGQAIDACLVDSSTHSSTRSISKAEDLRQYPAGPSEDPLTNRVDHQSTERLHRETILKSSPSRQPQAEAPASGAMPLTMDMATVSAYPASAHQRGCTEHPGSRDLASFTQNQNQIGSEACLQFLLRSLLLQTASSDTSRSLPCDGCAGVHLKVDDAAALLRVLAPALDPAEQQAVLRVCNGSSQLMMLVVAAISTQKIDSTWLEAMADAADTSEHQNECAAFAVKLVLALLPESEARAIQVLSVFSSAFLMEDARTVLSCCSIYNCEEIVHALLDCKVLLSVPSVGKCSDSLYKVHPVVGQQLRDKVMENDPAGGGMRQYVKAFISLTLDHLRFCSALLKQAGDAFIRGWEQADARKADIESVAQKLSEPTLPLDDFLAEAAGKLATADMCELFEEVRVSHWPAVFSMFSNLLLHFAEKLPTTHELPIAGQTARASHSSRHRAPDRKSGKTALVQDSQQPSTSDATVSQTALPSVSRLPTAHGTVLDQTAPSPLTPVHGAALDQTALLIHSRLRMCLATCCCAQGCYEDARNYCEESLKVFQQILGEVHPLTLWSKHDLANFLNHLDANERAEALSREVYAERERQLGPEHPDTLAAETLLANCVEGTAGELEILFSCVFGTRARLLGQEHPLTLRAMQDLAMVRSNNGPPGTAKEEQKRVVELLSRTLGPEHPITLESRWAYATFLKDMFNYRAAYPHFESVYREFVARLGSSHWDTLNCEFGLAACMHKLNMRIPGRDAREMLGRVLKEFRKKLGDDHKDIANVKYYLADLLMAQGHAEEACPLITAAVKVARKVHEVDSCRRSDYEALLSRVHEELEARKKLEMDCDNSRPKRKKTRL